MSEESTESILRYQSDEAKLYRGTMSPFRSEGLKPGSDSLCIPHTIETMRVFPSSKADFGQSVYFDVLQKDVLLGKQTLSFVLPQLTVYSLSTGNYVPFQWPTAPACAIVESVELYISGIRVDKIDGEHLYVKIETENENESKYNTIRTNIGEDNSSGYYLTTTFDAAAIAADSTKRTKSSKRLYLPLDFWFGDSGNEIPNIGTIRFRVNFRALNNVVIVSGGITSDTVISTTVGTEITPELSEVEILVESYWVPDAEKLAFFDVPRKMPMRTHYMITLKTVSNGGTITARTEYIPKPIKHFVWVVQNESVLRNMGNVYFKYTGGSGTEEYNLMETAEIYSGTTKIQRSMPSEHFNVYIPTIHGRRTPASGIYTLFLSKVPVDVGNVGSLSRSLGFKMTTQTGVGDLSARIFTDMYSHYTIVPNVYDIFTDKSGKQRKVLKEIGSIEFSATI